MVPEGIRQMIDAGISLCGGCGDSSDPEQQLHPAWACTEPTPPQPIPGVSGMVPELCQPREEGLGAALLQPALPQMFCILDFFPFQPR